MEQTSPWLIASTIVSAIATVVSALAAVAMWWVSQRSLEVQKGVLELQEDTFNLQERTLDLQVSIEDSKKPKVHIWFDSSAQDFDGYFGSLTFINSGHEMLPIRTLSLYFGTGPIHNIGTSIGFDENSFIDRQTDFILRPAELVRLNLRSKTQPSQFTVRVMYYDNGFEWLEIDTSKLGPYILTGKGKIPGNGNKNDI